MKPTAFCWRARKSITESDICSHRMCGATHILRVGNGWDELVIACHNQDAQEAWLAECVRRRNKFRASVERRALETLNRRNSGVKIWIEKNGNDRRLRFDVLTTRCGVER